MTDSAAPIYTWSIVPTPSSMTRRLVCCSNLLTYGPAHASDAVDGQRFYVVPRPGTISPWASKATDIAHNCGLGEIRRIERGIVYRIVEQR